jgi:hypothetical protein
VTTRETDVTLQEAFRSLAELPVPAVSDELRERIWLAVSGELPPAERRELIDRMATDPACAEAWRVAHEMWMAFQPSARIVPWRRTSSWTSPWLAAAATFVVVSAIGIVSIFNNAPADEFRSSAGYVVTSLVPGDTPLPRSEFLLQWTPAAEGSRYQIRVTAEDLQVVATATDLTATRFVVPSAQLTALPDGASVFWQVDALLPTGERITSTTFVARVK